MSEASKPHSMQDDIIEVKATLETMYLGHPDHEGLAAFGRIVEQLEAYREVLRIIASNEHPLRPSLEEEPTPKWLHPDSFWWHYLGPDEVARRALDAYPAKERP